MSNHKPRVEIIFVWVSSGQFSENSPDTVTTIFLLGCSVANKKQPASRPKNSEVLACWKLSKPLIFTGLLISLLNLTTGTTLSPVSCLPTCVRGGGFSRCEPELAGQLGVRLRSGKHTFHWFLIRWWNSNNHFTSVSWKDYILTF